MKLIQSDAHSVTARHLPLGYWPVAGLLAGVAFRSRTPGLEGPLAWMLTRLFLAVALGLWGQVVTLTRDSRRRVAVVRRFGLLGCPSPTGLNPIGDTNAEAGSHWNLSGFGGGCVLPILRSYSPSSIGGAPASSDSSSATFFL